MDAGRNVWILVILANIIVSIIDKYYQLINIVKEIIYAEHADIDIVCIFNRIPVRDDNSIARKHNLPIVQFFVI